MVIETHKHEGEKAPSLSIIKALWFLICSLPKKSIDPKTNDWNEDFPLISIYEYQFFYFVRVRGKKMLNLRMNRSGLAWRNICYLKMQRTQKSPFRWIKPLKNFSETWLFLLIRTHYFKWLSSLFITKWVFYYKINNYSNIALGVSPYMVKTSAATSWLCWVWRSLSFFLSTDSPLNTIVSGLNEPQDYKIQNSNIRLVLDLK